LSHGRQKPAAGSNTFVLNFFVMNPGLPYLLISCVTDAVWNICLKRSKGIYDWPVNILGIIFLAAGIIAFKKALSYLSLSIAIVTWSGLSLILTIILDVHLYNTKMNYQTIFFIFLCIVSIAGLNFYSEK